MIDFLEYFQREFLSYVLTLDIEENKIISFGDLVYDYDLRLSNGKYILSVYSVALDHYGMPYRSVFEKHEKDISNFFCI